jgi:hypothetical protein
MARCFDSNETASDTQQKVKKKFMKYKAILIRDLGKKALYDNQIDRVASALFGSKWGGCFPIDQVPIKPYKSTHYFVLNTATSNESGEHWIALVIDKSNAYIYDSFGRQSRNLVPLLVNILGKKRISYRDSNHDAEQFGATQICGQLCLAWLMAFEQFGKDALLI